MYGVSMSPLEWFDRHKLAPTAQQGYNGGQWISPRSR